MLHSGHMCMVFMNANIFSPQKTYTQEPSDKDNFAPERFGNNRAYPCHEAHICCSELSICTDTVAIPSSRESGRFDPRSICDHRECPPSQSRDTCSTPSTDGTCPLLFAHLSLTCYGCPRTQWIRPRILVDGRIVTPDHRDLNANITTAT